MSQIHDEDKEMYIIEQILKFIKFDNDKEDFYAYIPDNHVIITDINKEHKTIKKINLGIGNDCYDTVYIGDIKFFCELLTRKSNDDVLLSIEYYDDPCNKLIGKNQKEKLIKFIECLILGYSEHIIDYRDYPGEFYSFTNNDAW